MNYVNSKILNFRIPESWEEKINERARRRDMKRNEYMRDIIFAEIKEDLLRGGENESKGDV